MVESVKTDLETSSDEKKMMMAHGTKAQFQKHFRLKVKFYGMTPEEVKEFDSYTNEPATCAPKVSVLLNQVLERLEKDTE